MQGAFRCDMGIDNMLWRFHDLPSNTWKTIDEAIHPQKHGASSGGRGELPGDEEVRPVNTPVRRHQIKASCNTLS